MLFTDMLPQLLTDAPGCPPMTAVNALRNASVDFCAATNAWNDLLAAFALVDGQRDYTIASPAGARALTVMAIHKDNGRLVPKTLEQIGRDYPGWQTMTSAMPDAFSVVTGGLSVRLFPTPLNALSAQLSMRVSFAPTIAGTSLPDWVAEKYFECLLDGARSRLLAIPQKAWSDAQLAAYHGGRFMQGKADALLTVMNEGLSARMTVAPRRFGF